MGWGAVVGTGRWVQPAMPHRYALQKWKSPGVTRAFRERDTGFEPATFSLGS